jgi:SAM-dependent methyltransferase
MRSNQNYLNKNLGRNVKDLLINSLKHFSGTLPRNAIDLGCGLGIETAHLATLPEWSVLAIDSDVELLSLAKNNTPRNDRVTFLESSFETLTSLPACDLLYSYHSLHFIDREHYERLWNLVLSSIKPGGVIAISLFGPEDSMVAKKHAIGISEQDLRNKLSNFEIQHFESVRKKFTETANYFEVIGIKRE